MWGKWVFSHGIWLKPDVTFGPDKTMEIPVFVDTIWFWALAAAIVLNLLFALIGNLALVAHKPIQVSGDDENDLPPLSVIVVARNEIENLKELIPLILNQDYPDFELIVINDRSYDGSHDYLYDLSLQEKRLSFLSLDDEKINIGPGKKFGITMAAKRAKNECLVLTDADCRPVDTSWLKHYGKAYQNDKKVVLGYSPYTSANSVLNLFIRFECFWVGWQYLSFAIMGKPYMAVGRNMGYTKSSFIANQGFAKHVKIPYGDDDLLTQEIASGKNTAILIDPASQVESVPKKSMKDWLKQKKRHLAAGIRYKASDKIILSLAWLAQIGHHILFVLLLIFSPISILAFSLYAFTILIWWIFAMVLHIRFKMFKQWWLFPLLQPIYNLFFLPTFSLSGWLNPPKRW